MNRNPDQKKFYENGLKLLQSGDYTEAFRALRRALKSGYHEKSFSYLVYCLLQQNDWPVLNQWLNRYPQAQGFSLYSRYWLNFLRGDLGELDTLRESMLHSDHYFLRCFSLRSDPHLSEPAAAINHHIHFSGLSYDLKLEECRASIYLDHLQGHHHLALTQVKLSLKEYPDHPELLMDLVNLVVDMANPSVILEVLTDPVLSRQTLLDFRLMWTAARAWYRIRQFDRAEGLLERLHKRFPSNPLILYHLANIQASRGKTVPAIRLYRESISLAPLFERALFNLGTLYLKNGYIYEALPCFEKALRIKKTAQTLHNITCCLIETKRLEDAYLYLNSLPYVPGGLRREIDQIKQKIREAAVFM